MLSNPCSPLVFKPEIVRKVDRNVKEELYARIVPPFCTIKTRFVPSPAFTNWIGSLNPVVMAGTKVMVGWLKPLNAHRKVKRVSLVFRWVMIFFIE